MSPEGMLKKIVLSGDESSRTAEKICQHECVL